MPVPGDYDGDGTPISRCSDGVWYVKDQPPYSSWGTGCDIPQPLPYALRTLIPHGGRRCIRRAVRFTGHRWMYDCNSLRQRLSDVGFRDVVVLPPGVTTIPGPRCIEPPGA